MGIRGALCRHRLAAVCGAPLQARVYPYLFGSCHAGAVFRLGGAYCQARAAGVDRIVVGDTHHDLPVPGFLCFHRRPTVQPATATTVRNFAELVLGIISFFLILNDSRRQADVDLVACLIMLAGAAGAAIAIGMYVVPKDWAVRVLDTLTRFNYPGGAGALRYINDDPTLADACYRHTNRP